MSEIYAVAVVLAGFVVRLGIPVFLTVLIVHFLRILDERWQLEGKTLPAQVEKPACWEIKNCPPGAWKDCPGYTSPLPCWQARRMANGYLREECFACKIFLKAPVPSLG
jgi:hypothetical protein